MRGEKRKCCAAAATRQTQLDSRGLKIHPGISVSLLCLGQNKNTPRWNPVNLKFAQSDGCQSGSQLKKNVVWGIKIVVCLDQNLCEDKKGKRGSEMGQLACIKAPSGPYSSYWLTLSEVLMGPYWWITHQPILLINNTCAHRRSPSLHTHTHTHTHNQVCLCCNIDCSSSCSLFALSSTELVLHHRRVMCDKNEQAKSWTYLAASHPENCPSLS